MHKLSHIAVILTSICIAIALTYLSQYDMVHEYLYKTNITGVSIKNDIIYIGNTELLSLLRKNTNVEELYLSSTRGILKINKCISYIPSLKLYCASKDNPPRSRVLLHEFVLLIEQYSESYIQLYKATVDDKKISYENLYYLFPIGQEIYFHMNNVSIAGIIYSTKYKTTLGQDNFIIKINVIKKIGDNTYYEQIDKNIPEFDDLRLIETLPVKLLNNELKRTLHERGKMCIKYLNEEFSYVNYDGFGISNPHPYRNFDSVYTKGRVVIDHKNFNKNIQGYYGYDIDSRQKCIISEPEYFMVYPFLPGYDISNKKSYMEFFINNISPIKFKENIMDSLMVPHINKEMIIAFINNTELYIRDVISGKGDGLIFLLHGPPGVGKTLTAETIAEYLKKPVYYVNVGELGTNVEKLENNMKNILDIAYRWKAILLLDEADIFLETRDNTNIERNAMVGVFLRLLEYYPGIIFLTSNRAKNIDSAIKSRIHMTFEYDNLSYDQKMNIWTYLIKKIITHCNIDIETLCNYNLNGRQIRTAINLAQGLSKNRGEMLSTDIIITIIKQILIHPTISS
jgi:hypothetical protein